MAATLYEIVDNLLELEQDLVNAEGELTPEAEEALEALPGDLATKLENILGFALEQEALAAVRKGEAGRLAALARTNGNRSEALRRYMTDQLLRLGTESVQTRLGRLVPQRNTAPSLKPRREPEKMPEAFRRVRVEVDGAAAQTLWRETVAAWLGDLKGEARRRALPEARAKADAALRKAGFDATLGWHLRTYS